MITDEMVKAAEDEGAKWCSGAKHGHRGSVWSVVRDDVVISEHESDDKMSIALAEARTRAALEAAERAAWQPIYTAPRSGRILIEALSGTVYVAEWVKSTEHGGEAWKISQVGEDQHIIEHARRWRPLPLTPTAV